ncbi:MAG: ABC transporter ATP-binding protein [Patescibacteria group bacterium]
MRGLNPQERGQSTYSAVQLLYDQWMLIRPYRTKFIFASLSRLIGDVVWLYPPIALAGAITFLSSYHTGSSLEPLYLIFILWFGAAVVRTVSQLTAKRFGYEVGQRAATDASFQTTKHLTKLDIEWHEQEHSGNKLKRIHNAELGTITLNYLWFNSMIEIMVNIVGVVWILSTIDLFFAGYVAVFLILFFSLARYFIPRAAAASLEVNKQEEVIQGTLFEIVANIRTVKILGAAKALLAQLTLGYVEFVRRVQIRIWRNQSRVYFLAWFAESFRIGGVVIIGWGIVEGQYEVGFIILFYQFFSKVWESISELANNIQEFMNARYAIERRRAMQLEPVRIDTVEGKGAHPEEWRVLHLRDVSFSYGGNGALHAITFDVKRGEKIGIVGLSGAGKSTLFKLLLKEREDFTGAIQFDETPIQSIERESYFMHVSAVLQDTEVFNLTLRDNISISGDSSQEQLDRALEIAHITDFVHKLPKGLDTIIGEKGIRLSGGERQRLGIARAIYKAPQLLLLDEATSHLDSESEEKIRDSLAHFFENVTAIVVAHRLSTIRAMDKILVIEGGQLVEAGSFDDLYQKHGRFFELWEKQKL